MASEAIQPIAYRGRPPSPISFHGSKTGVLLSRECRVEAGDVYPEDEAQDRFGKRQTYL
jgi:hypothetical protein